MKHELPALPCAIDVLQPQISQETLEFHHGTHHQTYVNNPNNMVEGTEYADSSLADIIKKAPAGPIFNNAAQIWNHTCYWNSMSPNRGGEPTGAVADAINKAFGSFEDFKKEFSPKCAGNFGSGWTSLVKNANGSVATRPLLRRHAGGPAGRSVAPSRRGFLALAGVFVGCRAARVYRVLGKRLTPILAFPR